MLQLQGELPFSETVSEDQQTIVLTFNTAILPKHLKVGYLKVAVDVYVPNPLQCYCCYKFGHHKRNCKLNQGEHVCRRCGNSNFVHQSDDDCEFGIRCVNARMNMLQLLDPAQFGRRKKKL